MDTKQLQKLALIVLGAAVIHLVVAIGFLWVKNRSGESHKRELATLQEKWAEEDADRRSKQEEELVAKYGTTKTDRIAFDPRMDIKLVLQKLFQAVMPPEYTIKVEVDRFTEFSVSVNVYNMPESTTLAAYLKEIFSRVDPRFAYQVMFYDEERFWIIDQGQLTNVRDWQSASVEDVKKYCFPISPF
jgi:hypothetical protein